MIQPRARRKPRRSRRDARPAVVHDEASDIQDLATFGYRPELRRSLGRFSAFAAGFSYLSILTGTSQTFYLGYGFGGPAFFWTWPVVFVGQLLVALCFAELAAHYPLAGGVYQWSKHTSGGRLGWLAGWVYLACMVVSLAAVALALQSTLPLIAPQFQFLGSAANPADAARNAVLLGTGLIALTTFINAFGVRLLARLNNVGVVAEIAGATLLIGLLFWAARRGPAIVLDHQAKGSGMPLGYWGAFLAASLSASFVMYGFDTAGTLAEETRDPRRTAPPAILQALTTAALAGMLLVLGGLMAAGNLSALELTSPSGGLPFIIKSVLGDGLGRVFLVDIAFAITVCALAVHTGAVRIVFAMARDGLLPGGTVLARVNGHSRTPVVATVLVGLAAAGLLLMNINVPKIIEIAASVSIVWANLAYLLVTGPMLFRRLQGWPEGELGADLARFRLGRWGLIVNVLAVAWGLFVVVNIAWPRAEVYGPGGLERYAAIILTLGLLAVGAASQALTSRRRPSVPLDHCA